MIELLVLLGYCLSSFFLTYCIAKKSLPENDGIVEKSPLDFVVFILVFIMCVFIFFLIGLLLWNELHIL